MRKTRLLGSLAVVAAAAFALAGCSLLPAALSTVAHAPAPSIPKVGDCWNASMTNADNWADWEGTSPVACSASHVLYTYAVGKISGVTAKSWAKAGSPSTLSDAIQTKAEDACSLESLLPKLAWNQQLVEGFFFVPSEADWRDGARWVRCDVGVLGFGATLSNEVFSPLPTKISTLVAGVSSDPEKYQFCVNSPVPVSESGPLDDSDARIADCRQNPQWALTGRGNLPEPPGAAYPSNATANAEAETICSKYVANTNEVWIAYLPDKTEWNASNDREINCWIGQKSDADNGSGGVA